ncbi:hypothetical protein C1646_759421 [Rhizophagus diaphanus]|nr:hypothetical protein C1646_759421 [Rhizophagus diaphanus] [Rhizophagus sp. MUCL 43196]
MRILVVLQNVQFIITVVKGHPDSLQQPGYICEAGDLTSAIFNNPSAAVTTLYQRLFNNSTKFSGPLIMGHNKVEISKQLLEGVIFHPFGCFIRKFWLFVYGIGVSSVQDLSHLLLNMYQDFELRFTYVGNNPNNVWQKIDILRKYRGVDIFGISHPQVQTFVQILLVPRCQPEEWHIINKMQALWNYHLRKFTLASIQWNEFFIIWYNETKTVIELITSLKKFIRLIIYLMKVEFPNGLSYG